MEKSIKILLNLQNLTFNNVFRGRFVYLGLGYIGLQYFVEHVDFALLKVFVAIE